MIEEFKTTYHETYARKRAELESAIERGEVSDPITATLIGWGISSAWAAAATSAIVSVAVSAASYAVSRAFAPKPPNQYSRRGQMSGSLQIQNSDQGVMIPEIYGAGPTITLVPGSNPTWQNLTNTTGGANGSITKTGGAANTYDAGASHNVAVTSGDAFIEVIPGTGPATAGFSTIATPTHDDHFLFGVQWHSEGTLQVNISGNNYNVGYWKTGDKLRVEIRSGRFRLFKNSAEISNFAAPVPVLAYPLYFGVAMYASGSGMSNAKIQIGDIGVTPNAGRGGIKIPAMIVWTSGIRRNVSVTSQPVQGGKGGSRTTQTVENITYDIDLRLNWCRGPAALLREYANADVIIDEYIQSANPSGVYDPTIPPDPTYNPQIPPPPQVNYTSAKDRVDGNIVFDLDNVGTGTIQGGGSLFAVYQGNTTQDPDPTEEADINARYGSGSTTAHRNISGIVHKQFSLSRWSGIVPNMTAVWEHATLKTLDTIYGSFCNRATLLSGDYSWAGLSAIKPRGMLIAGRLFQPAEVIDSPELQLTYNYFSTEVEGQIVGYAEGAEPSLTIADTEVGWLDGETDVPDIIPEVESILASEILLERQVDVKFIDPDNEWDSNTQSAKRQITDGVSTELLEVQVCLLADEARAVAQRKLYRDYVAGTAYKFTLPWTYLYLHPGYKITITRAEGFTHILRLTSITGGIGVLDCEGIALEPSVFNQPAVGSIPVPYQPPQTIPAMTIMSLLDTPLLREGDITNNDGVGWYWVGTPRTGFDQAWQGAALYIFKNNQWMPIPGTGTQLPGTIGSVVSVSDLYLDPDVVDIVFTVDSTTDIFSSTLHLLTDTDEVTVGNTGGTLPAPLVAGTSYFIRDKTASAFKLALTSGGAAINITSNGTGTNFINVGKIVVDLYGTTQTLSSVAKADMLTGANEALAGDMIFRFANATQVAGFPNRWTLTTLLTGQKETDEFIVDVAAGDRFVLLNEAVKFVPMDEADLNNEMEYRAVTVGQSLDDAATVLATWFGAAMRGRKVTDLTASRDASGNWHASAEGHPRQLPAYYNLRVRRPVDDVLMRDIPIATGITQSAVFGDTFGNVLVTNNDLAAGAAKTFTAVAATDVITAVGNNFPDGHKVRVSNTGGALSAPLVIDTDYFIRDKVGDTAKLAATLGGAAINLTTDGTGTNSIRTAPFVVSGARMTQEITEPGAFIEFVLPALDTLAGGSLNLAFFHSADAGWTDTSAWTLGVYTIRLTVLDVVTGEWSISFWDVGGESAGQILLSSVSLGLGAMKIRATFSGSELRIYKDWANTSTAPLVISKVPPASHFPMKAAFYLVTGAVNNDAARIEEVVIGGMVNPSTIYSKAQQDRDDPVTDMATIDFEMWQVSTVEGRKVRAEFP